MPNKVELQIKGEDRASKVVKGFVNSFDSAADQIKRDGTRITRVYDRINQKLKRIRDRAFDVKNAFYIAGGAAGLGYFIQRTLQATDMIGKTADKLGITTKALQEYRFAASQSGVAQRALDMGLQRFSRRLAEAAQGQGELKGLLEQYDVQVRNTDGSMRAYNEVLGEMANHIKNAESEQEALRIAFKMFDSEGAALVNMLRDGSEGLQKFRTEADSLGLVLSDRLIRDTAKANDAMDKLWRTIKMNFTTAVAEAAPAIEYLSNEIINWMKVNKNLIDQGSGLISFFDIIAKGAGLVINSVRGIELIFSGTMAAIATVGEKAVAVYQKIFGEDKFKGLRSELQHLKNAGVEMSNDLIDRIVKTSEAFNNLGDKLKKVQSSIGDVGEKQKNVTNQVILPAIEEIIEKEEEYLDVVGNTYEEILGIEEEAMDKRLGITEEFIRKRSDLESGSFMDGGSGSGGGGGGSLTQEGPYVYRPVYRLGVGGAGATWERVLNPALQAGFIPIVDRLDEVVENTSKISSFTSSIDRSLIESERRASRIEQQGASIEEWLFATSTGNLAPAQSMGVDLFWNKYLELKQAVNLENGQGLETFLAFAETFLEFSRTYGGTGSADYQSVFASVVDDIKSFESLNQGLAEKVKNIGSPVAPAPIIPTPSGPSPVSLDLPWQPYYEQVWTPPGIGSRGYETNVLRGWYVSHPDSDFYHYSPGRAQPSDPYPHQYTPSKETLGVNGDIILQIDGRELGRITAGQMQTNSDLIRVTKKVVG